MRGTAIPGCVVAAILLAGGSAGAAAETVYTDQAQWALAAGGAWETEDFSDGVLNAGLSFTSSESGHINPSGEYYQDVLASTSANSPMTTWSFETPMRAYGGQWTLGGAGGSGNALLVYLDDAPDPVGWIPNSYNGEFWGFASEAAFDSVRLIGAAGTNQQNYRLDDMVYSPVPEPASSAMLLGALALLFRRRRKTAAPPC